MSLVTRFGVLSAVLCAVVASALFATVQHVMEQRARAAAVVSAEFVARVSLEPVLAGTDLASGPLSEARRAAVDELVSNGMNRQLLVRIKVFDRDQRIVYADDPRQTGRRFHAGPQLRGALAGRSGSTLIRTDPQHAGERGLGVLLEVFVPLHLDGDRRTDGVAEIYVPYAPVQAAVAQDARQLLLIVAAGLVALWLVLMAIVVAASRQVRRELQRNSHQALHDALTGLPNRVLFFERLQEVLARRRRDEVSAVLLLDLNGFKDVNDSLGHAAGDELLCEVAARLRAAVRETDTVARLGGDEFAFVVSGLTTAEQLNVASGRIELAFSAPFLLGGISTWLTPSIGTSLIGPDGDDADELLRKADAAMYAAKRLGGGTARYDPSRDDAAARLLALQELRHAIDHGELRLQYQPSVRLSDRLVTGAEALVRWQHPGRGLLPPSEFLPLAEQSQLIGPLTAWVLDEAVGQCRRWVDDGLDLCVAINLSGRSVIDARLPDEVRAVLDRHGLPPQRVVFEVTETSLITRPDVAARVLGELSGLGVNIAVDDFGTGYATLQLLQQLPFNALKIDRGFVADIPTDGPGAEMVRYTAQLAHALGKVVVAEGVETEEQWDALERMGCDHAQGYFIARPLTPEAFATWLTEWELARVVPLQVAR